MPFAPYETLHHTHTRPNHPLIRRLPVGLLDAVPLTEA